MNSRLRHGAIVGSSPASQLEFGQEVGSRIDVDVAFGVRGVEQA